MKPVQPVQPHFEGIDPGPSAHVRQAAGQDAERWAEHVHHLCEVHGVAWMRKIEAHLRPVGGGRVVPVRAGTIDCLGVLRGGRALGVEIKSCSTGTLIFERLPVQQRAHLAAIEALGGVALVLVVGPRHAWAIEWRRIARLLEAGAKSVGCSPLDTWPTSQVIDRARPHPYLARWAAPEGR